LGVYNTEASLHRKDLYSSKFHHLSQRLSKTKDLKTFGLT
jgi:hypothetical protein